MNKRGQDNAGRRIFQSGDITLCGGVPVIVQVYTNDNWVWVHDDLNARRPHCFPFNGRGFRTLVRQTQLPRLSPEEQAKVKEAAKYGPHPPQIK